VEIRENMLLDKYSTADILIGDLEYFAKQNNTTLDKVMIDIEVNEEYGSSFATFEAYLYRPATSEEIEKERVRKINQDLANYKRAQEVADRMAKELGIK